MATQPNTGSTSYSSSDRSKGGVTSGLSSHSSASGSTSGNIASGSAVSGSATGSMSGGANQGSLTSSLANAVDPRTMDRLNHFKDEAWDKASVYFDQSKTYIRSNPFYFIGGAALLGYLIGSMVGKSRSQSLNDRSQSL